MKFSTDRAILFVRILLLVLCCTFFMPQGAHAQKSGDIAASIRAMSMTLAVTGITNPVSHLQNLANGETATLRNVGQRAGVSLAGKRTNLLSSAKRNHTFWFCADDDASPAVLPSIPPLPDSFRCERALFSFRVSLPESHGHIHWFALAPPASLCA